MKKLPYLLLLLLALVACDKKNTFCLEGTFNSESVDTLYLEHLGLMGNTVLDSVVLPNDGHFRFRAPRPEYPDLYRLRIGKQWLILAVDSLETIHIEGEALHMAQARVDGSAKTEQIQFLRESLRANTLEQHKDTARIIIYSDPKSIVAYYALFQVKAGAPVFNPYVKEDLPCFRAVATSFQAFQPGSQRTKVLYQQVLSVIQNERQERTNAAIQAYIEEQGNALLDIHAKDVDGNMRSLSDKQGHLCVLSFTSTLIDHFPGYAMEMRELWNEFHGKGLEIYEFYPDPNRLAWEDQVRALPWTCVRSEQALQDPIYSTYNVQALPTIFVIERNGDVVARVSGFDDLKRTIQARL